MQHKLTTHWRQSNTRINKHFFLNEKYIYHQLLGYLGLILHMNCVSDMNVWFTLVYLMKVGFEEGK